MYNRSTIHDKLEEIKESIELIQEWSKDVESADDFMLRHAGLHRKLPKVEVFWDLQVFVR